MKGEGFGHVVTLTYLELDSGRTVTTAFKGARLEVEMVRRGLPRPGQWGERARKRRARRLERAAERREALQNVREWERGPQYRGRAWRRSVLREGFERRARNVGLEPLPGESTRALRMRLAQHVRGSL